MAVNSKTERLAAWSSTRRAVFQVGRRAPSHWFPPRLAPRAWNLMQRAVPPREVRCTN